VANKDRALAKKDGGNRAPIIPLSFCRMIRTSVLRTPSVYAGLTQTTARIAAR
jgi:hypothetical protein